MDASFTITGSKYSLTFVRRLRHSPEKVWRVLTERELLRQWFPCDIEGVWQTGEKLKFTALPGDEELPEADIAGEVLAADPPFLLEFRWGDHSYRCEVTSEKDGCRLEFMHSFDDPSLGARYAAGWDMCLANLDLILSGAAAAEFNLELWQEKFAGYAEPLEVQAGPQKGLPDNFPTTDD